MDAVKPFHLLLAERRTDTLGTPRPIRQEDIADEIGRSQAYISKIERGKTKPEKVHPEELYKIMLGYRFTRPEIIRIAEERGYDRLSAYVADIGKRYAVKDGPKVKHLGVVNAGMLTSGASETTDKQVNVPDEIADRYDLNDVFAVDVDGDSMVSEDVRDTIPPGSLVFFHSALGPNPGDIVCVYLVEHDHSVIKRYEPSRDFTVLRSLNNKHEPIVLSDPDAGILQGVYLAHIAFAARMR